MGNVYTKFLYEGALPIGGYVGGPVPDGKVWVFKDICVTIEAGPWDILHGFQIQSPGNVDIFREAAPNLLPNHTYHWFGTEVILPGDTFFIEIGDTTTHVRISGFELALP